MKNPTPVRSMPQGDNLTARSMTTVHLACHCQTHVLAIDYALDDEHDDANRQLKADDGDGIDSSAARGTRQDGRSSSLPSLASLFTPLQDDKDDVGAGVCDCTHCLKRRIVWYGIKVRKPSTRLPAPVVLVSGDDDDSRRAGQDASQPEVASSFTEPIRPVDVDVSSAATEACAVPIHGLESAGATTARQTSRADHRRRWLPRKLRVIRGFTYEQLDSTTSVAAPSTAHPVARIYRFQSPSYPSRQSQQQGARHVWCGTCGTYLLGDAYDLEALGGNGKEGGSSTQDQEIMINLRAIRDADFELWDVPLTLFSGASRPPAYQTLPLSPAADAYLALRSRTANDPPASQITTYAGRCHCQLVRFKVLLRNEGGIERAEINDCACSICRGGGALWVYPHVQDVYFEPSPARWPYVPLAAGTNDNAASLFGDNDDGTRDLHAIAAANEASPVFRYTFGPRATRGNGHYSCRRCGCHVLEYDHENDDVNEATSGDGGGGVQVGMRGGTGINVALLDVAGEYLGDVLGLTWPSTMGEGEQGPSDSVASGQEGRWKRLQGLMRTTEDRDKAPLYALR